MKSIAHWFLRQKNPITSSKGKSLGRLLVVVLFPPPQKPHTLPSTAGGRNVSGTVYPTQAPHTGKLIFMINKRG